MPLKEMKVNRSKRKLRLQKQIESVGKFPHQNLQKLIDWLYAKQTEFISQGYTDVELKIYDGSWDDQYEIVFYGVREEDDKEFNQRMREVEREKKIESGKLERHRKFIETEAKKLGILT